MGELDFAGWAAEVAQHLPGNWTFEPRPDEFGPLRFGTFVNADDGMRLRAWAGDIRYAKEARCEFSPAIPDDAKGGRRCWRDVVPARSGSTPECTAAIGRSAKAVAGQVTRAVILPYREQFAGIVERTQKAADEEATANAFYAKLCASLGYEARPHDQGDRTIYALGKIPHIYSLNVRTYGVELKLNSLPYPVAEKLLQLLREAGQQD